MTTLVCGASIPSGTQIQIRLLTAINTANAKADQAFDAVIIAPAIVNNSIVIAPGVKVSGHVKEVKAATDTDAAVLLLDFDRLNDGDHKTNIQAKVAEIDNAREKVDTDGRITGILASETGAGRLQQGISKVSQKYPGLGDLLGAVQHTVLKGPDPNVDYEAGVEMTMELTKALDWSGNAQPPAIASIEPAEELARMVNAQPYRTATDKTSLPSDVTNVMFIGSQEQLQAAFQQAGWSTAERLDSSSKLETFRALAEDRGYKEAPVSILRLEGAPPDLVFEKLTDTFAARHHLRIWHRPGQFHGQDIWVCSSTHDTGIDFSEEKRTFIHKIDSNIDRERSKVVNDLLFTGLVRGLALVERQIPPGLSNATGDQLQSDGSMAVIRF